MLSVRSCCSAVVLAVVLANCSPPPGPPDAGCNPAACADRCSEGNLTRATCTATGCSRQGTQPCANGYACADGATCKTSCASDGDCQFTYYCGSGGQCLQRKPQGSTCNLATECTGGDCRLCEESLFCTDGVCCNKSAADCSGCNLCTAPTGTCGPVIMGLDPHGACANPMGECQLNSCNGDGSCFKAQGTACGTNRCVGGTDGGAATLETFSCSQGQCVSTGPMACPGNLPCESNGRACLGRCAADGDCEAAGTYCSKAGQCVPQLAKGAMCDLSAAGDCKTANCRQCATGFCVDGRCCDRACSKQCETCDLNTPGTCSLVINGAPRPSKQQCVMGACGGKCDGQAEACVYPGASVSCGGPTCVNSGTLAPPKVCSGTGTCVNGAANQTCAPYICVGAACTTSCTVNTECAPGLICDTPNGVCIGGYPNGNTCSMVSDCSSRNCVFDVNANGSYCCNQPCTPGPVACDSTDPGKVLIITNSACGPSIEGPAGTCRVSSRSCNGYMCRNGACLTSCTSAADCSSGFCLNAQCQ